MKALPIAIALLGAVALVAVGATAAAAAGPDIDPGDSMYTISCDQTYNDWQLLSVAPPTAISTPIGDGDGTSEFGGCAGQAAYDLTDGMSYYVQITFDGENVHWALAEINVATGVSTTIDEFWWENGEFPELVRVDSIAIGSDGAAYALGDGVLYSLDLATAVVDPIDFECITAFAFASHPTTGEFYAIDRGGEVFQFDDIASGCSLTSLGYLTDDELVLDDAEVTGVFALQIDGGGTFWIDVQTREGFTDLWSFTPTTLDAPVRSGEFTDDPFYTQSLLIVPGEVALAATGAPSSAVPVGVGAGVIVLLGAGLLLGKR